MSITERTTPPEWWVAKFRGDYGHVTWEEQRRCAGRGHSERGPGLFILANGVRTVTMHCLTCGAMFGNIPKAGLDLEQLPLVRDNTRNAGACSHLTVEPAYIIASNGTRRWGRVCLACDSVVDGRPSDDEINSRLFCRVIDYRKDDDGFAIAPPCDRCGSQDGSELHHWAPRAIFGKAEADRWPTAYLCRRCHTGWHQMVTPQLCGGGR